jgi:hypothetical protein
VLNGGKLSKALAIMFMLWCAGAGCLLVSYTRKSIDDLTPGAASALQAADAMTSAPSCHTQRQQQDRKATSKRTVARGIGQPTRIPARSGAMKCCPLGNGSMAAASRSQITDDQSTTPHVDTAKHLSQSSLDPHSLEAPLRLPDQHYLYLSGCVFLI